MINVLGQILDRIFLPTIHHGPIIFWTIQFISPYICINKAIQFFSGVNSPEKLVSPEISLNWGKSLKKRKN